MPPYRFAWHVIASPLATSYRPLVAPKAEPLFRHPANGIVELGSWFAPALMACGHVSPSPSSWATTHLAIVWSSSNIVVSLL